MANFDCGSLNVALRKQRVLIQSGSRPVPFPQGKKMFRETAVQQYACLHCKSQEALLFSLVAFLMKYCVSSVAWRPWLLFSWSYFSLFTRAVWTKSLLLSTLTKALWLTLSLCISVLVALRWLQAKIHCFTLTDDDCSETIPNSSKGLQLNPGC